jgi:twitching motility protein PilT
VEKLLNNANGLLLVAGRTGAGKTTTLASMVDLLNNKRESIIISIEKPIEYIHTNKKCLIKQREVGKDTDSFYAAAKNALRQNPDVLVIGEILETMEVAIAAAESGTLVLTTIHAPSSSQALDRIASFFPPEVQRHILGRLSLVLKGVITQNLIPRVDRRGLAVATEVLVIDSALKHIIKDGLWAQIPTAIQVGKKIGMQSMEESLDGLYRKGIIDIGYLREYL